MRRREALTGFALTLPAIAGMCVFFIVPFGICIYYSLTSGIYNPKFVGLANYISVFNSAAFRLAAWNTFRFLFTAVPLIMVVSLLIALILFEKLKGFNFFRTVFIFPLVLPVASVVMFFQIVFSNQGIVNAILTALHLPVTDWLNSPGAFWVLVLLYVWKNMGYNIILFMAALNSIPKNMLEAAKIDGAGRFGTLFRVSLPLIVPYIFFILMISIINSFKSFREAFMLCGAHPNQSIYMLQHFVYNNFMNLNYLHLSVAAISIFIVVFAMVFVLYWIKNKMGSYEL